MYKGPGWLPKIESYVRKCLTNNINYRPYVRVINSYIDKISRILDGFFGKMNRPIIASQVVDRKNDPLPEVLIHLVISVDEGIVEFQPLGSNPHWVEVLPE